MAWETHNNLGCTVCTIVCALAVDLVNLNLARQKRDNAYSWFADTKDAYFHLSLFSVIHLTMSGTGPILLSRVRSVFYVCSCASEKGEKKGKGAGPLAVLFANLHCPFHSETVQVANSVIKFILHPQVLLRKCLSSCNMKERLPVNENGTCMANAGKEGNAEMFRSEITDTITETICTNPDDLGLFRPLFRP